jgi:phosphate transport system protein
MEVLIMAVRAGFDSQINDLKLEIIRMSSMVEETLAKAMKSLIAHDSKAAQEIIDGDDVIDDLRDSLAERCVTLIATQQPMASDLRIIFASVEMTTDIERIADYAVGIARITVQLQGENYIKPLVDLPRMTDIACEMMRNTVQAFANRDADMAIEAAKKDNELDGLYQQVYKELAEYVMEDPRCVHQMIAFVLVARYLERVGDHITNLCEWIVYNETGRKLDLD